MDDTAANAVAIVGIGAVMPDAPDAAAFWNNIKSGRYSISDVPAGRWATARPAVRSTAMIARAGS